jgi:hypothetical protein
MRVSRTGRVAGLFAVEAGAAATAAPAVGDGASDYRDGKILLEEDFESWRRSTDDGQVRFDYSPNPNVFGSPSYVISGEIYTPDKVNAHCTCDTEAVGYQQWYATCQEIRTRDRR